MTTNDLLVSGKQRTRCRYAGELFGGFTNLHLCPYLHPQQVIQIPVCYKCFLSEKCTKGIGTEYHSIYIAPVDHAVFTWMV